MPGQFKNIAFWDNLQQKSQPERCSEEQVQTSSQRVDPSVESQSQAVSCPIDSKEGVADKLSSGNAERNDVFFQ
jgi:hypothetical protein